MSEKLQDKILKKYGEMHLEKLKIPSYISQNLNKQLRDYQQKALKYYLANNETLKQNHLMFNMATGSGKTLIMAALILDCFKNGYENFIFFVNSKSILEKTKANFADKFSSKYLFSQNININSKNIEINIINSLQNSKSGFINIYFTTIQNIFSLFTNERENAINLYDLESKKLIFLADEAHHLNAETKNKLTKNENEIKQGWEGIIKKAFNSHIENKMFEFSATIPKDKSVQEKYIDKIIYEYDLAKFSNDGYAKRIYLMKYSTNIESRILGSILLSLWRELIALKNNIDLKPVILYKSESIAESKRNHNIFINFINNLDSMFLQSFYENNNAEYLAQSLNFFKQYFEKDFVLYKLTKFIKEKFKKEYILNTNDEKEIENNQILLNSLESQGNNVRVIFSVDKLNEGWDVLNLFDIVRLQEKSGNNNITTKEAQLIGRGARYYPFNIKSFAPSMEYKRKFDSNINNELSILERLIYHTINEVKFIENLNKTLTENGLLIESPSKIIKLTQNESLKEIIKNDKIYYIKNKRQKRKDSKEPLSNKELESKMQGLVIPLISNDISQNEVIFTDTKDIEDTESNTNIIKNIGNVLEARFFQKALNVLEIGFDKLKLDYTDIESKIDFINKYLNPINIICDKKQKFDNAVINLEIAKFILKNFRNLTLIEQEKYEVTDFEIKEFNIKNKEIFTNKIPTDISKYQWLYYHAKALLDSELEKDFLVFIESKKDKINLAFEKWFILRNENFNEFKIYDNRENEESYAKGFSPDFILFTKKENDIGFFATECFIEAKGRHLALADKWKEDFLKSINSMELVSKDSIKAKVKLKSLPFFMINILMMLLANL